MNLLTALPATQPKNSPQFTPLVRTPQIMATRYSDF